VRVDERGLFDASSSVAMAATRVAASPPRSNQQGADLLAAVADLDKLTRATNRVPIIGQRRVDKERILERLDRMRALRSRLSSNRQLNALRQRGGRLA
jgi:hypothetical protein